MSIVDPIVIPESIIGISFDESGHSDLYDQLLANIPEVTKHRIELKTNAYVYTEDTTDIDLNSIIDEDNDIIAKISEYLGDPDDNKSLIISRHVATNDFSSFDFSLSASLIKKPWEFRRGARTKRDYVCVDTGDVAVSDQYFYHYSDEGRIIDSFTRHIEWYTNDGSIGITKDVTPEMTTKRIKELNRTFRQGQIDYLEGAAEEMRQLANTVPEPYKSQYNGVADSIDFLFTFYKEPIREYIERGTRTFENALDNETDSQMLQILAIPTLPPNQQFPNGLVIKTAIMYQLRGWLSQPGDSEPPN